MWTVLFRPGIQGLVDFFGDLVGRHDQRLVEMDVALGDTAAGMPQGGAQPLSSRTWGKPGARGTLMGMTRFARDRLRDLAGEAAFARGEAYCAGGAVLVVAASAETVVAEVRGSEIYTVRLHGSGHDFGGDCTCPAFDRDGWCKHLVATALAVNAAGDELPDTLGPLRGRLVDLGAEALADLLLDLAERDPALLRRLDLRVSAASAPATEHAKALRQALTAALHPRHFVAYGEAGGWAADVLDALDQVPALIKAEAAGEAKTLLERVLDDLPEALNEVDDSDGEGTAIVDRAAELHIEACRALRPEPVLLAQELFERALDDDFGTFSDADATYAEILGEVGLTEYRRLAETAYARLPPLSRPEDDPDTSERRTLAAILDRFAERDGDVDARIALRRAALTSAYAYLHFARFCLDQGRPALALQAAEDGAWLFEDQNATALVAFLAERLLAEGRREEAIAALWRGFERTPAFGLFQALHAADVSDAADRALAVLHRRQAVVGKADRWRVAGLVEMEINILTAVSRLPEAWDAAHRHGVPDHLLSRLAKASETTLPDEAAAAYQGMIERQIEQTSRHGYEEACRLLERLAKVESVKKHAEFVANLRVRYRAKRTLLPMLDRHLADSAG